MSEPEALEGVAGAGPTAGPGWVASGLGEEGGEEGGAIIWVAAHNGLAEAPGAEKAGAGGGGGVSFDEHLALAMERLGATLHEAGAGWGDVVSVRAYLARAEDADRFEERYAEAFSARLPARTVLFGCLRPGSLFEIECVAVRPRPNLHVGG